MKKTVILLCVITALLLAACGREPESSGTVDSTEAGVNPTKTFSLRVPSEDRNQAFGWPSFVETAEGYYYDYFIPGSSLIYFCPRGGDTFYPLCSKPNCAHNDENCNAWCNSAFGYYNGALYLVDVYGISDEIKLIKMNLDGTDHQVVATIDDSGIEDCGGITCTFHHGKLYLQCTAEFELPLEMQEDHLVVVDLADYSQTEPAKEFLCTARLPVINNFYENKLYGRGTADKNLDAKLSDYKLIELDALSGEARVLVSHYIDSAYVTDSTLYYLEADLSYLSSVLGEEIDPGNPGFRELNLENGEVKYFDLPAEDIKWAYYDEDYIYAGNNNGTLYFISRDYQLVDQLALPEGEGPTVITSDRLFFIGSNTPINFYLDKAQIGSGELTLVPIKTVG